MLPHLLADKNKIEDYGIMPHMLQSQKFLKLFYCPKLRKIVTQGKGKIQGFRLLTGYPVAGKICRISSSQFWRVSLEA
jgi:hypothetical protein